MALRDGVGSEAGVKRLRMEAVETIGLRWKALAAGEACPPTRSDVMDKVSARELVEYSRSSSSSLDDGASMLAIAWLLHQLVTLHHTKVKILNMDRLTTVMGIDEPEYRNIRLLK